MYHLKLDEGYIIQENISERTAGNKSMERNTYYDENFIVYTVAKTLLRQLLREG